MEITSSSPFLFGQYADYPQCKRPKSGEISLSFHWCQYILLQYGLCFFGPHRSVCIEGFMAKRIGARRYFCGFIWDRCVNVASVIQILAYGFRVAIFFVHVILSVWVKILCLECKIHQSTIQYPTTTKVSTSFYSVNIMGWPFDSVKEFRSYSMIV